MTDDDRKAAVTALIGWFKSQDIDPADAAQVMSLLIAEQLVIQSQADVAKLQQSADMMRKLLLLDMAAVIRAR